MKRIRVELAGKQYSVSFGDSGTPLSIWTKWDVINPRTAYSASPEYWTRSASISLSGRLGRQIIELAVLHDCKVGGEL